MTYQLSVTLRNNKQAQNNATIGTAGVMKVFSGAEPANCAASDPTGLLCTITLPASPFGTASGGAVALAGTWSGTASAGGTIASWRIYDGSAVCHMQGNTSDLTFNNTNVANGQSVTVTSFTDTAGNA